MAGFLIPRSSSLDELDDPNYDWSLVKNQQPSTSPESVRDLFFRRQILPSPSNHFLRADPVLHIKRSAPPRVERRAKSSAGRGDQTPGEPPDDGLRSALGWSLCQLGADHGQRCQRGRRTRQEAAFPRHGTGRGEADHGSFGDDQ